MQAAQEFKSREAWVPTAGMYLRMSGLGLRENISPDIQEGLRESVYKASFEEEMPLYVFFERIDAFDLPLGYVVRGRYALFHGSIDDAKLQLSNAEAVQSDMYEAFLLKAEIEMQVGSREAAKNILLSLSSDLGAAPWIRDMAAELLTSIQ